MAWHSAETYRSGDRRGGATITGAGMDDRFVGLVYIAAVAPDAGETVQDQLDKYGSQWTTEIDAPTSSRRSICLRPS